MAKVLIPIADGSEDIESVTLIDVLRRAEAKVIVASVQEGGGRDVVAARGTCIKADCHIADCVDQDFDLIALPGGMPGAEHLRDSKPLVAMLHQQKAAGRLYAAICASPAVVFAHHGLIDGVNATCHPNFTDQLAMGANRQAQQRVVVDGHCITSQGPGTAIEFSLELVRQLYGDEKAQAVADPMVL